MRFSATVGNLFSNRAIYNDLTEKIATQKKVNRASDDPLSSTRIITIRQSKVAFEHYMKNIDSCKTWVSATESTLSGAAKLLETANQIAVGGLGGDAATREIAAGNIQAIIESMRSLANTKWGDRYLFSGSREGVEPFAAVPFAATIEQAQTGASNLFSGTATSSGAFTGSANKTYALKITEEGALGVAKYRISTDGGRTWGAETLSAAGGAVNLGDGVILTFDDSLGANPLGRNDTFFVNANAAGYYRGNDESLSMTINRETVFEYSITGAEAFTEAGGIGIFETLTALKEALINNDSDEIVAQRLNIEQAQGQILLCQSRCGMNANHLEVVRNNLAHFDETLTMLLSDAQDADITELAARLLISETALKASYSMAGKIGELSILNYLE
jgi:flagellin-like hook-associated protein FlgL